MTQFDYQSLWMGQNGQLGWYSMGLVVFAIMFLFFGMGYMISAIFATDKLRTWIKEETYQIIVSFFIFVVLISAIGFFNEISKTAAQNAGLVAKMDAEKLKEASKLETAQEQEKAKSNLDAEFDCSRDCHITVARFYLHTLFNRIRDQTKDLLGINMWVSGISTLSISKQFFIENLGLNLPLFSGFQAITNMVSLVVSWMTRFMIFVKLQEIFMRIVAYPIFPMLLLAGVILRSFFLTRRLGGLLIAVAIATYYVVPSMYIISDYLWNYYLAYTPVGVDNFAIDYSQIGLSESGPEGTIDEGVAGAQDHLTGIAEGNSEQGLLKIWTKIKDTSTFYKKLSVEWIIEDDQVIEQGSRIAIYATFMPLFAIFGTVAFIKNFSPLLGGDVEIAGLSRLI